MADKIGEVVVEVGADARDFRGDAERGIEKSLKKIGKRIERAADKWARDMRDSVKDALDGLVLQVNARIDPKDLRRIERAIGQTRGQAHAEISKRDIEDIKRQLRQMDSRAPVKPVLDDNAVAKLGRELDEMKAQIKARVDLDKQSQAKAIKDLKGIDAEIDAKVEINGSDIAEIKEKIANIKSDLKVNASLEKAAQNKIRAEVEKIDARLQAKPELDNASAKKIREEIKALGAKIETEAHLSEASKKKIKHELNKLDGKATVNADLDDGKARFDLARLTKKPYFVDIHARLAKASLIQVATQLKALAGGNIFGNLKNSLSDLFTNLDTVAVKMASVGVAAGGLISILGSGLGVVSAFGVGVAHSLPALLALPGILGAAGAGIGIFVAAMKDAKDVLADLGPRFTALQQDISLNFWGEAADAVRNFANSALDALGPSISNVAAEMGSMAAAVADAATDHIPGFAASLEYLRQALDIGGDGAGAFTDALLSLGEVGAKYLPAIAGWANGVAYSFQNWVQAKIATGEMDQAIQGAAKTFGTLKDIVFDLGGIIGGLFTAMAAGSAPIDSIAGALDRANQAVNGPLWQGTLTSIFSSMATAANFAFQGVGSLGGAFVSLAPTISTILPLIGQIIQTGLNGISLALQDPAFQGGLVSFFQNVLTAVQALAPAMPALGAAFGAIATVAGQLLAAIAPLLATLLTQLAPVITQLAGLLAPIIEQLAAALMPVIQALVPIISELFAVLGPIITELLAMIVPLLQPLLQALTALLIPALQLVGTVVQALMPIFQAVFSGIAAIAQAQMQILKGIIDVVTGLITGDWSKCWEGLKGIFMGFTNFMIAAFTGFGRLIVAIAQAAWNLLGNIIMGVGRVIINTVTSFCSSVVSFLSNAWSSAVSFTSSMWSSLVSTIRNWISSAVNTVRNLPNSIKNVFSNAGSWLLDAGKKIIQGLINGISSMIGSVKSKLSSLTSMLPSWKGPEPVDKVLLKPAGQLIMQGFIKGLESQYGAVRGSLQGLTDDLTKPATIGLNATANVKPMQGASARGGKFKSSSTAANGIDKQNQSGATINITNHYPQAKADSKTRDEVAEGIRLAALI